MIIEVCKVNEEGFIVEMYLAELSEDGTITSYLDDSGDYIQYDGNYLIKENLEDVKLYFKPKWTGMKWVEGESAAERTEREAEQQLESFPPSPEALADAELEIKIITLLTELEVIQP